MFSILCSLAASSPENWGKFELPFIPHLSLLFLLHLLISFFHRIYLDLCMHLLLHICLSFGKTNTEILKDFFLYCHVPPWGQWAETSCFWKTKEKKAWCTNKGHGLIAQTYYSTTDLWSYFIHYFNYDRGTIINSA